MTRGILGLVASSSSSGWVGSVVMDVKVLVLVLVLVLEVDGVDGTRVVAVDDGPAVSPMEDGEDDEDGPLNRLLNDMPDSECLEVETIERWEWRESVESLRSGGAGREGLCCCGCCCC